MDVEARLAADAEEFVKAVRGTQAALAGLDGVAKLKEAEIRLADIGGLIAGTQVHGPVPGMDRAIEGVAAVVGAAREASSSLYSPSRVAEACKAVDAMTDMFGRFAEGFAPLLGRSQVVGEVVEAKVAGLAGQLASLEAECSKLGREIEDEAAALLEPPAPRKGFDPTRMNRIAGAASSGMGKGTGIKGPGL